MRSSKVYLFGWWATSINPSFQTYSSRQHDNKNQSGPSSIAGGPQKSSRAVRRNSMNEKYAYSSMSFAEDKLGVKVWVLSKDENVLTWWQRENTGAMYHLWQKIYIRRWTPTCLPVWHGKTRSFLGWETAMQLDTWWNRLLYSWSPEMLKFYLNAIQDTLPAPANLKTWNKHPLGQCSLCGYNCCTMLHIFNCCQYSPRTGQYNWRHDMVLCEIVHQLVPAIIKARCPAVDDGDKQSVTGIAFRTESGNKNSNGAWLGTGKQEI